jgi:hypothetical protein
MLRRPQILAALAWVALVAGAGPGGAHAEETGEAATVATPSPATAEPSPGRVPVPVPSPAGITRPEDATATSQEGDSPSRDAGPAVAEAGDMPAAGSPDGSVAPPPSEPGGGNTLEPPPPTLQILDLTLPEPAPVSLRRRDLCVQPAADGIVEESRAVLTETFCAATLWFDGLFGGEPDVRNARAVSGRVELTTLYTDYYGEDLKARLRLRYDLPNLERRVRLFLGRESEDEFIEDRQEGLAVRSSVFGLEGDDEQWLAGLGWYPPGRWQRRFDVRVGGRVKSAPEVFVQGRFRYNAFVGEHAVWRFRETIFYENREGFGSTTSIDVDRVLRNDLLLRWGNVGTWSEENQGLEWRSAAVLYKNLRNTRAIAGEVFSRGATDAEVKIWEYGTRLIYREPLRRPYLFGEVIVGYTWPRHERFQPREGSAMVGFGLELLFGQDPY